MCSIRYGRRYVKLIEKQKRQSGSPRQRESGRKKFFSYKDRCAIIHEINLEILKLHFLYEGPFAQRSVICTFMLVPITLQGNSVEHMI